MISWFFLIDRQIWIYNRLFLYPFQVLLNGWIFPVNRRCFWDHKVRRSTPKIQVLFLLNFSVHSTISLDLYYPSIRPRNYFFNWGIFQVNRQYLWVKFLRRFALKIISSVLNFHIRSTISLGLISSPVDFGNYSFMKLLNCIKSVDRSRKIKLS